jgi:hypothetical protein
MAGAYHNAKTAKITWRVLSAWRGGSLLNVASRKRQTCGSRIIVRIFTAIFPRWRQEGGIAAPASNSTCARRDSSAAEIDHRNIFATESAV